MNPKNFGVWNEDLRLGLLTEPVEVEKTEISEADEMLEEKTTWKKAALPQDDFHRYKPMIV